MIAYNKEKEINETKLAFSPTVIPLPKSSRLKYILVHYIWSTSHISEPPWIILSSEFTEKPRPYPWIPGNTNLFGFQLPWFEQWADFSLQPGSKMQCWSFRRPLIRKKVIISKKKGKFLANRTVKSVSSEQDFPQSSINVEKGHYLELKSPV